MQDRRRLWNGGGGRGGAIKAERVCRLVLQRVRTRSPDEEGILHSWIGGPPLLQEVGNLLGYLTAGAKPVLLRESGTVVPLLTSAASARWCPPHAGAGMLHIKSSPVKFEGAHHH